MKKIILPLLLFTITLAQAQTPKRKLMPGDVYRLQTVSDAQVSPDGNWIAYVLTSVDSTKDKRNSDVWMVSKDGTQSIQMTNSPDGESSPRWSPDGKYLSFLSSRQGKNSQVWVMDRRGGEGSKLTSLKHSLSEYEWSPDAKKILLVMEDAPDTSKTKTTRPIVIDKYHFKQDVQGYRTGQQYTHLYLYDLSTKKIDTLTTGRFNVESPAWSPDGSKIAFVSNRTAEPDKNENSDIFIIDAKKGSVIKQLTTWTGPDDNPKWSPDGKSIAYLQSTSPENYVMYDQSILAIIPKDGGEPKLLTKVLDRPVAQQVWSEDGRSIAITVTDDRQRYVGSVDISSGQFTKVIGGNRSFYSLKKIPGGGFISLMSEPQLPTEIFAIENGNARRLTKHQDEFLAPLMLASVEGFTSKSKDGTSVSSILLRPAGASNQKLATVFFIHGGPVAQDEYGFDLSRQMLAANGYNVVGVNYRGSSGRGLAYCKAIYADWGNKEVMDIHGAVDHLVKEGIADPDKLGIGGWSYGGILTDYCIATDTRFKVAASGAGSALQLSVYGSDQYVLQYENELGVPWKNLDKYLKLSYPFLKADKIKTPTLFMVGEKDFNVPAIGSEQMYQALRSLDIPTGLVIYPGQFHGITVPSYQKDRFVRYQNWFDKYLKGMPSVKVDKEIH